MRRRRGPRAAARTKRGAVRAGQGAFGGACYGTTNRVRGVPKCVAGTHVNCATGALGGAPYCLLYTSPSPRDRSLS
eukprot:2372720-Pyramimonas_sp.AAC.1